VLDDEDALLGLDLQDHAGKGVPDLGGARGRSLGGAAATGQRGRQQAQEDE
jgi:hypothetical protein